MKTLTVLNEKGGVGKTTVATTLAAGLAIAGYDVMLVDADPQGHAGLLLGVEKSPALYDLIVRGAGFGDVVVEVAPERYQVPDAASDVEGHLFLVASNIETRSIVSSVQSDPYAVLKQIMPLDGIVDFVIFDTSPTPSELHTQIYMASDEVLYPAKLSLLSLDGLSESLKRLTTANKLRAGDNLPPVKLGGVIPNMTRMRTIEHHERFEQIRAHFGHDVVFSPLALRTDWEQAATAQRSIFSYAPMDQAAHSARRFVNEFLKKQGVLDVSI